MVEAKVVFGVELEMKISRLAVKEARKFLSLSRFTLARGIGHVIRPERKMKSRNPDASRPRGSEVRLKQGWIQHGVPENHQHFWSSVSSKMHPEDADMEWEENVFAGAFLIPYSVITCKSVLAELTKKYFTSIQVAERLLSQVMQSWRLLHPPKK